MSDDPYDFLSNKNSISKVMGCTCLFSNGNETVCKVYVSDLIKHTQPLPEFVMKGQRDIDWGRIDKMVKQQEEEYIKRKQFSIASSVITLGTCVEAITPKNPYGVGIIDGQHRTGVWGTILKFFPEQVLCQEILVKICTFPTYVEMKQYFDLMNINFVPVSNYNTHDTLRDVSDGVAEWVKNNTDKKLIKTSKNPHRPNISLGIVKDKISNNPKVQFILDHHNGNTAETIKIVIKKIHKYSKYLENQSTNPINFKEKPQDSLKDLHEMIEICENLDKPTFLGMERDHGWIAHALEYEPDDEDYGEVSDKEEEEEEEIVPVKKTITVIEPKKKLLRKK
jgi:hypothetical protein